jgi:hypothetical protein
MRFGGTSRFLPDRQGHTGRRAVSGPSHTLSHFASPDRWFRFQVCRPGENIPVLHQPFCVGRRPSCIIRRRLTPSTFAPGYETRTRPPMRLALFINAGLKMRLWKFDIKPDPPGRQNIWAVFLIMFSAVALIQGIAQTHWMLIYRVGDSIIPRPDSLTEVGPFSLDKIRTRNSVLVRFIDPDGQPVYQEDLADFGNYSGTVIDLIEESPGRPIAYLNVYKNNPIQQVWSVEISGIKVLSYARALRT